MKRIPFFASAQPATKLRAHEIIAINPGYVDLTFLKTVRLDQSTPYIWVLTADNHIILGIERPWDHPSAFVPGSETELNKIRANAIKMLELSLQDQAPTPEYLEEKCGLGHPTLSAKFTPSGDIDHAGGKAFIAGALTYDTQSKAWLLNNKSGRFYKVQGKNVAGIEYLLGLVAAKVSEKINDSVTAQMEKDKLDPAALWEKTNRKDKNAEKSLPWRMFNIIGKVYKHIETDDKKKKFVSSTLESELLRIEGEMLKKQLEFSEKDAVVAAIRYFRQLSRKEENPEIQDELNIQIRYMINSIFRNNSEPKKSHAAFKSKQQNIEPPKQGALVSENRFTLLARCARKIKTSFDHIDKKRQSTLRDRKAGLSM
ncbi:MAG: hypothetical protein A3F13_05600 [Gammaproteobacteria bacterium RIFCSPHIGHO2_12_FULL_40_19]|nr:MAG: hypothetical protein A3F13_05600 [Gammaproteobacteria bacterium RIFCSPHIGHO2_12_FULL_40_19]